MKKKKCWCKMSSQMECLSDALYVTTF